MESRLKLLFSELQPLYMRHLLLKELTINDVSLYILSLLFQYKKRQAFDCYKISVNRDKKHMKECLLLLLELEDRFINAIVSYRIGYCYDFTIDSKYYYKNAYDIFDSKTSSEISSEELFYKGCILINRKCGVDKNIDDAIKHFESNSINLYIHIGIFSFIKQNYIDAIHHFKKAVKLNCPLSKYYVAMMLKNGLGCDIDIKRSLELCKSAAEQGHLEAIDYLNQY